MSNKKRIEALEQKVDELIEQINLLVENKVEEPEKPKYFNTEE